jgi:integrase
MPQEFCTLLSEMKKKYIKYKWYLDFRNCTTECGSLKIVLTAQGQQEYIPVKPTIKLTAGQWELIQRRRGSGNVLKREVIVSGLTEDAILAIVAEMNAMEDIVTEVLDLAAETGVSNLRIIKEQIKSYNPKTEVTLRVKTLFEEYIASKDLKLGSKEMYKTAYHSFLAYHYHLTNRGESDFYLTDITKHWLMDYACYNNFKSCVYTYERHLRAIFKYAIRKGYITSTINPFDTSNGDGVRIQRQEAKNIALSREDMAKFVSCIGVENVTGLSISQQRALDYLMVSFLLGGANFADVARLKYSNINKNAIVFQREKTKARTSYRVTISVQLSKELRHYIGKYEHVHLLEDDYIFPILTGTYTSQDAIAQRIENVKRRIVDDLKEVKVILGFSGDLNFGVIRHTYATYIYENNGHDIDAIRQSLGHTDVRTTQNYLDSIHRQDAPTKNAVAMEKLIYNVKQV